MIKKLLLSREAKNVNTLEAIMKENSEIYEEFIAAMEHEDKEKLIEKWRPEGVFRALVEACISIRVEAMDLIRFDSSEKDEVLRSFNLEFTAPRIFNEIINWSN